MNEQDYITIKTFNPPNQILGYIDKDEENEDWPIMFHAKKKQFCNIQIIGPQGSGKSELGKDVIYFQGKKKKEKIIEIINIYTGKKQKITKQTGTQVYWFSNLKSDSSTDMISKDFRVTKFDNNDLKEGVLIELLEIMKTRKIKIESKPQKQGKQHIKHFLVFDDIHLKIQYQEQLLPFIKSNRHYYLTVMSLSQDIVQQNIRSMRSIYNVQIFFCQINNARLRDIIYKEQKGRVTWDQFDTMYDDATQHRYSFLCIDNRNEKAVFQKKLDKYYDF